MRTVMMLKMIRYSWLVAPTLTILLGVALVGQPIVVRARKGDGGPAVKAELNGPSSITIDPEGNLYVYEGVGLDVRRIDGRTGIITTILTGCVEPWKKPRPTGCLPPIGKIGFDPAGDLLLSEFTYNQLVKFDFSSRSLNAVAGNGDLHYSGDGGKATDAGIAVSYCFSHDGQGNLFVCDSTYRIRRMDGQTGIIATVAGHGERGFGGDGGPALDAKFGVLVSMAVDRFGSLYVADDTSNRIRRIDSRTGVIDSFVGAAEPAKGGSTFIPFVEFSREGGPAAMARFNSPRSLIFDPNGNLVFALQGRVCKIDNLGNLKTIAGTGEDGYSGDGGAAIKARIGPNGLAMDKRGNLFIAEYESNRIRRVDAQTGVITTVAGNGLPHRPPQSIM